MCSNLTMEHAAYSSVQVVFTFDSGALSCDIFFSPLDSGLLSNHLSFFA
jgi:hypothetical protein